MVKSILLRAAIATALNIDNNWEPKQTELVENLKREQQIVSYQRLSPKSIKLIDRQYPFT
jgi:hypothetical protein